MRTVRVSDNLGFHDAFRHFATIRHSMLAAASTLGRNGPTR